MVLLLDQPADREHERHTGDDPGLLGRRLGTGRRHGVEAVVDRLELPGRQSGLDVEGADRVGDRDDPLHTAHQAAVDVTERAEQIPVVVVAGRDERDAQEVRGERAVGVRVNHVRMQEVGTLLTHA